MTDLFLGVGVGLLVILASFGISALILKFSKKKFHYPAGGLRQLKDP